jgi:hypothetical protein
LDWDNQHLTMVKIRANRQKQKRRQSNRFEDLPEVPENETDESEDDTLKPIKPAGTRNADGTFYGGGPNDFYCSKCKKAGFPAEYSNGHRSNQRYYCPQLQKHDETQPEIARKQLTPTLQSIADDCIPVRTYAASAKPAKDILRQAAMDPDDVLVQLADGVLNPQAAKLTFLSMMKSAANAEDRSVLQTYIDNVDAIAPAAARKTLAIPNVLQTKGKLAKTYSQVMLHVHELLHKSGKPEHKQQPKFNLSTGELTVDTPDDVPVQSMAVFNMALEKFRHIVVTRDHLSESELHSLTSWIHMQLALGKNLTIMERCFKKTLQKMDEDHSRDLTKLIQREARSIMDDETDIHGSFHRSADTSTAERAAQSKADKAKAAAEKATSADDRAPLPLKVPNSACCWYDTNGLKCPNKLKINGVCKYAHLHGTCGMPLADGSFCQQQHKAAEHPQRLARPDKATWKHY